MQLGDGQQEMVECSSSWQYKANFAFNLRSMAVLVALSAGVTNEKAKSTAHSKFPKTEEVRNDQYAGYKPTDSQQ